MARPHISEEASSYYPPRARWYSFVFSLGNVLRRRMVMVRINFSRAMKIRVMDARFFVAALAGSAALFLIFIVWLGYAVANLAFGLLISLHATGFVYYCNPLMAGERFRSRLAFTFLMLMAIGLLLYMPARSFIQGHWVTPLRINGHIIVVQRSFQPRHIQRGDWVAYTFD